MQRYISYCLNSSVLEVPVHDPNGLSRALDYLRVRSVNTTITELFSVEKSSFTDILRGRGSPSCENGYQCPLGGCP